MRMWSNLCWQSLLVYMYYMFLCVLLIKCIFGFLCYGESCKLINACPRLSRQINDIMHL